MQKFRYRLGNLEVRSCGEGLMQHTPHDRAEIIEWTFADDGKEYCFVLAYFEPQKDENDYDLQFVGGRPFQYDDWQCFMTLANFGYETLIKLTNSETN